MENKKFSFGKEEKLCGIRAINELFESGKSLHTPHFRVVYMVIPSEETPSYNKLLISIPKRLFKKAVTRNLLRRRIKEAYRKNKSPLLKLMEERKSHVNMAIIWKEAKTSDYREIELAVIDFITRLSHLG